jgi:hypothetical protein
MAKDERIFRVVKAGYRGKEKIKYATRTAVSGMFSTGLYGSSSRHSPGRPDILRVEAINPADIEWDDVTDEFRNKPEPRCKIHTAYTGVRKPYAVQWRPEDAARYLRGCKCWGIYQETHPDYPTHDPLCSLMHTDPAACSCQMLKKLLE